MYTVSVRPTDRCWWNKNKQEKQFGLVPSFLFIIITALFFFVLFWIFFLSFIKIKLKFFSVFVVVVENLGSFALSRFFCLWCTRLFNPFLLWRILWFFLISYFHGRLCVCVDNLIDSNPSKMMKMIIMMATIGLRFSFLFSFFCWLQFCPQAFVHLLFIFYSVFLIKILNLFSTMAVSCVVDSLFFFFIIWK